MAGPRIARGLHILPTACLLMLAQGAWAAPYPPKVGQPHPQIILPTLDGERVIALSTFRGRKVLLVHFASW